MALWPMQTVRLPGRYLRLPNIANPTISGNLFPWPKYAARMCLCVVLLISANEYMATRYCLRLLSGKIQ